MIGADDRNSGERGGKPILRRDDFPPEEAGLGSAPQPRVAAGTRLVREHDDLQHVPLARPGFAAGRPATDDDDPLPWLESSEELYDEDGIDSGRLVGFVVLGLLALAIIVATSWIVIDRASGPGAADGSLVRAEPGPYKVKPESPGGETFEGTGDSSFAVSEGQTRGAKLASADTEESAAPSGPLAPDLPGAVPVEASAPSSSKVGVQVGAYMSEAQAEASWPVLVQRNAVLSGLSHRVVEGRADMGTVYRLQAVTANLEAANALCTKLRAAGQGCQVKR